MRKTGLGKKSATLRWCASVAVFGALAGASPASAGTYHFMTNDPLGASYYNYSNANFYINGVYCHELDYNYTRNIGIGAAYPGGTQYGSWVIFQTQGLRSYSGSKLLAGACYNPHSVSYFANAHVNY